VNIVKRVQKSLGKLVPNVLKTRSNVLKKRYGHAVSSTGLRKKT
jgi:hypothetical protein